MKNKTNTLQNNSWIHPVAAIAAFLLAYVTASWAIDSGKLQAYFATIVLLVLGIQQIVQTVKKGNAK